MYVSSVIQELRYDRKLIYLEVKNKNYISFRSIPIKKENYINGFVGQISTSWAKKKKKNP